MPKKLEYLGTTPSTKEAFEYFIDLNSNGVSERITLYDNVQGNASYYVRFNLLSIFRQFDFNGESLNSAYLGFLDHDNDGFKEIYNFYHRNDSVFVSALEFSRDPQFLIKELYVAPHLKHKGKSDIGIRIVNEEIDYNDDGYLDLYFQFNAQFLAYPRSLFRLDVKNQKIESGPKSAINSTYFGSTKLSNGTRVFYEHQSTPSNTLDFPGPKYHDEGVWFKLTTDDLAYYEEPKLVKYGRYALAIYDHLVLDDIDVFMAFTYFRKNDSTRTDFYQFDEFGNALDSSRIWLNDHYGITSYHYKKGRPYLLANNGTVWTNDTLGVIQKVYDAKTSADFIYALDLNQSGQKEVVFTQGLDRTVTIINSDFTKHQKFDLPTGGIVRSVHLYDSADGREIIFDDNEYLYRYRYIDNVYSLAKYPAFAFVFVLLFVFAKLFENYRFYRLEASKKELIAWQLKALKNQIDPHFTFNVLNSVSAAIHKGNRDDSIKYFNRFSNLLRQILEDSDDIVIPLGKEIEIVENYLALEKLRFKQKLEYHVDIEEGLNHDQSLPKLIILNQTENAIKHGLMHKEGLGRVEVRIKNVSGYLNIEIEDNGIGRKAASQFQVKGLGKGEDLTKQSTELFKKVYEKEIQFKVNDLFTKGLPSGTLVTLKIKM